MASAAKKRTASATVKPGSKASRRETAFLSNVLPTGWDGYFSMAINNRGLKNECAVCGALPPEHLTYYQRWRWMAVHGMMHKANLRKL